MFTKNDCASEGGGTAKLEKHLFTNPNNGCCLCAHPHTHKHGKAPNGGQRYFCPQCKQTSNERFYTLYYYRQVISEQIWQVLQAHSEGSSLRGISRTSGLAYNTVVSIVRAASQKAQLVHNAEVQSVQTEEVSGDELWSFVSKTKAMSPTRARSKRLLDCSQFGEFKWINLGSKSWETH